MALRDLRTADGCPVLRGQAPPAETQRCKLRICHSARGKSAGVITRLHSNCALVVTEMAILQQVTGTGANRSATIPLGKLIPCSPQCHFTNRGSHETAHLCVR